MNKKGQVGLYITFMISALMVLFLASFFAPAGVLLSEQTYRIGEDIMLDAQDDLVNIDNEEIRDEINATLNQATANVTNNISVLSAFFTYGWVFVLGIVGMIMFIFSRRLVEFGGGFV